MNILVSGAASGLGLQFLQSYAEDASNSLIGIDIAPLPSEAARRPNVRSFMVDITSESSIAELGHALHSTRIDLVVHSAGVRGLVPEMEDKHPDDVAACETVHVLNAATFHRTLEINAVGTFLLVQSLLPNLDLSEDAKVVIMSSRMGSVGQNTAGSAYAYRASKAAVNAIVKSFSIDFPRVTFVLCHPGRVETKLVRCKEEGAISPLESVTGMLPLIHKWDGSDSGKFYDRFGQPILW